ncbi:hypothetical protein ACLK17_17050 [Escherichia coli]
MKGYAPLLVLPESGGAWLKTCYDAQNHAMLDDDSTLQKARTKFLPAYEGNMMGVAKVMISGIKGSGDNQHQRQWRPSSNSRNVSCYRCFALISHESV